MRLIVNLFNNFVSLIIAATILLLMIFMLLNVYDLAMGLFNGSNRHFVHDIAFIIVLIKAYRILLSYLLTHHVSITYIVETVIIAITVEIVFANDTYDFSSLIVLSLFGVINLFIYAWFFRKLKITCH